MFDRRLAKKHETYLARSLNSQRPENIMIWNSGTSLFFYIKIKNKNLNNLEISYIKRNLNRKFIIDSLKNIEENYFITFKYSKEELRQQDWKNYIDTLQNLNALDKTLIAIDVAEIDSHNIEILTKYKIPFLIHNTKSNKVPKKWFNNAFLVLENKIL